MSVVDIDSEFLLATKTNEVSSKCHNTLINLLWYFTLYVVFSFVFYGLFLFVWFACRFVLDFRYVIKFLLKYYDIV